MGFDVAICARSGAGNANSNIHKRQRRQQMPIADVERACQAAEDVESGEQEQRQEGEGERASRGMEEAPEKGVQAQQ